MINQNTQAERTVMVVERWRWDPEAKRWWQTAGLPDLWKAVTGRVRLVRQSAPA